MTNKNFFNFLFLIVSFSLSRAVFYLLGVRFDTTPLETYIQILDPVDLKNHLFQSIFYLHTQPPLFNLFLGIILKLFPNNYTIIFQIIYILLGFSFYLCLFLLMEYLGVDQRINKTLTVLFMINPSNILYENWLFYSYPVAAFLMFAAFFYFKWLQKQKNIYGIMLIIMLTAVVLTRSAYHFLWFCLWIVLISVAIKNLKKVLYISVIPLIIIFSICYKNWMYFQSFSLTSQYTFNYQIFTNFIGVALKINQNNNLKRDENISEVLATEFNNISKTGERAFYYLKLPHTGIPVLDHYKKTSGAPNINSIYHIFTVNSVKKEAYEYLKRNPHIYIDGIKRAYFLYFFPGPTDVQLTNRNQITKYENFFNIMFYHLNNINSHKLYSEYLWKATGIMKIRWDFVSLGCYLMIISFTLILIAFGIWSIIYHDNLIRYIMLFIILNILYTGLVSCLFTSWGTNRYRFDIDAFYVILFGLLLTKLLTRVKPQQIECLEC